MCNFDNGQDGFCEPCDHHDSHTCIDSSFITDIGTQECLKVCLDGDYGEDITTTQSTTTSSYRSTTTSSTTTQSTTTGASCGGFASIHDFLANTGAIHFEGIFTNEQDSFSRRPGQETHGLRRRKIQFTQWIDNIFMKMSKHLEKRRFISCFEEHGKLFDGGLTISEDFNQCPLIEATNIDDYFGNVINFVDWFYQGCGDAGKIMSKLQHRWNRINQIRDEIQALIVSRNRDYTVLDLNQYMIDYYGVDSSEFTFADWESVFWYLDSWSEFNPPNDDNTWTVSNHCISGDALAINPILFHLECQQVNEWDCFAIEPEARIYYASKNDHADLMSTLNCVECGCQPGKGPIYSWTEAFFNGPPADWTPPNVQKTHESGLKEFLEAKKS